MPVLDENNFPGLLEIHNVQTGDCSLKENRTQENGLYCWTGIASQSEGKCVTATVCDPISFIYARDRFCKAYGGRKIDPRHPGGNPTCPLDKFVPNLPGMSPVIANIRGGTVTYEPQEACKGLSGWFKCAGHGVQQSLSVDKKTLAKNVLIAGMGLFVVALVFRYSGAKKYLPKDVISTRALERHHR